MYRQNRQTFYRIVKCETILTYQRKLFNKSLPITYDKYLINRLLKFSFGSEEWKYLKHIAHLQASNPNLSPENIDESNESHSTEQQRSFIDALASAARRLLNYLEVNLEDTATYRLYDTEVIDLTPDISFILVVPPPETVCSVPGARESFLQDGELLSLPIQVFEMIHLNTYQEAVVRRYSRLSCILELDTAQAQHSHREAFSTSELNIAKDKLNKLQNLQSQVNMVWKSARWLVDVIAFARDKGSAQQGMVSY